MNRQLVLRRRPEGLVDRDDTDVVESAMPGIAEGEALMRVRYLGIDAAVRTWLDDRPGYLPPVQIGEVVRAGGVGEIVETKCDAYEVGDVVSSLPGFQQYSVCRDDVFTTKMPTLTDLKSNLSIYGSTGATACFGMIDIGKPVEGQTVVVSAAAGATGSIAGQIAKIHGCRVVGIAGSDDKCDVVVNEFGFDACINYKTADMKAALKEHCPKRVDIFFDNVGGPVLDAVLGRLAMHARVVLCGAISTYTDGRQAGPSNYVNLMAMRASMAGFNTLDNWDRFDDALAQLQAWVEAGQITYRETVFDGLASGTEALNGLFTGANIGKLIVAVE